MAGIIKAGDGGSGARARDGVGGNDSSNGAPYNGTSGDYNTATDADGKPIYFGGDKGSQGNVYYFGAKEIGNTEEEITNESKVIESNDGKQGSRGNDGWGGVNLTVYQIDRAGTCGSANQNKILVDVNTLIYNNAGLSTSSSNSSGHNFYMRVRYGNYDVIGKGTGVHISNDGIEFLGTYHYGGLDYSYQATNNINEVLYYYNAKLWTVNVPIIGPTNFWYQVSVKFYAYNGITGAEMYGLVKGSNNAFSWSKVN